MESNFDLKNLGKYFTEDKLGNLSDTFSFDFIIKIFMAAFVWRHITFDKAKGPLIQKRRQYLKDKDTEGYKSVFKQLEELEEKVFQSALVRVKAKLQV